MADHGGGGMLLGGGEPFLFPGIRELREELDTPAFSWRGFHHETSGVDPDLFLEQLRAYREKLGTPTGVQYLPLTEGEYRTWFTDPVSPVRPPACTNVEWPIDIQPTGEANYCVDFPDYSMGDVRESTIEELWNGERARRFREHRREKLLSACHRCGARHLSEIGA